MRLKLYTLMMGAGLAMAPIARADLTDGLVAHWTFEDGLGTDVTGNGHDGSFQGGATAGAFNGGQGLAIPNVDDYMLVPDHNALDLTGDFSIALQVQLDGWSIGTNTSQWGELVNKHQAFDNTGGGYSLYFDDNGRINFRSWDDAVSPSAQVNSGSTFVSSGNTYHIAVTGSLADQETLIYLDGQVVGTGVYTQAMGGSNYDLWFGAHLGIANNQVDGILDDIRFYDRALTSDEVVSLVPEPTSACVLGLMGAICIRRRRI